MILEIIIALLSKAGDYLVPPVGRQIRYFHRYRENVVEDFGKQVEKLGELVNETKRNGDLVKVDVQKWLTKVDQILLEAEAFEGEIKLNKRCFGIGWCPDWSSRYKLSKEVRKKAAVAVELLGDGKMDNVFCCCRVHYATMDRVMRALQDDECDIVGVYGMRGIGRTTFVKELAKKAMENKLFDCVAMAVVSQTPNLRKIQGQVADMLGLRLGEESEFGRAGRIHARLDNEKRVLIILDDIWDKVDLAAIGIPYGSGHKGLKIILTTRRENVCSVMGRRIKKFPLSFLSMEESWNLFRENAGAAIDSSTLNTVAMEVARKCRGLPLALVTVGRALQDKDLGEWKTALKQLKKSTPLNVWEVEHDFFSCLKLSYDYLESEEIKQFVLFCCLFPEDHDISVEDLGRFGMGKGLFRDEEARCQAQAIVKHLKASCLLLDSDKEGCVKMHDTVRDVGISIASRDNGTFLVRAGSGLKDWLKKETFEHYTDISLMTNDIQKLPRWLQCPSLEVLLLGENEGFEEIPNAFFEGMPQLRVLDLSERIGVRSLPLVSKTLDTTSLSQILKCLQTLHLNNCKLGNLAILGKLKKLEVLSFRGSDIQIFPAEIGGLNNLRLLDLSFCQFFQSIPPNVLSQLSQLEELYMGCSFRKWSVQGTGGERSHASLSELRLLHRLVILCLELESMACFPTDLHLHNFTLRLRFNQMLPQIKKLAPSNMLTDEVKVLFNSADGATLFCLMEDSMTEVAGMNLGLNVVKTLTLSACINMSSLARAENSSDLPAVFTALE
ncbi:hypothetical protein RJ639_039415 [Escallonia herrerae]|uniref:NB-ARC domain-containing protein n=1 Tax=Escallonia herrerae TaxID=1293975 RepID=A0AA88WIV0_9ASTE|nr:hypothetical protein RJ639_039415 [Escallonia herrerae]